MDQNIFILIAIGVASLAGLWIVFYFIPVGLFFTARLSGVDISIIQLVFMRYRKIPPDLIVRAMIKCTKAGVEIDHEALEAHYLAGGNLENVINGLIYAKAKNKKLTFMQASKLDLGRIDIVKELDKT